MKNSTVGFKDSKRLTQWVKICLYAQIIVAIISLLTTGLEYKYLYDVQKHNRLSQKGLLKRFSVSCYGQQKAIEEIRAEKAEQYKKLGNDRKSKEYQKWFLKYNPGDKKNKSKSKTVRKTPSQNKTKKNKSKSDYLY